MLEGVMMKSPEYMAIAVRKDDGEIDVFVEESPPPARKHKWMAWPIIRGVVSFCTSLSMGMKTINKSTDMLGLEDEEPTKFELWLKEKLGDRADKLFMGFAMLAAIAMAAGLFVVLPSLAATFLKQFIPIRIVVSLLEGLVRISLFVGYILLISRMKEIGRVFQYHGAEHMTVHCYEHDEELTVENAKKYTTLHPRCGTAFLFLVMVIAIVFFSVFGWDLNAFTRVISRLLMLPLVAGVSYEVLRLLAFKDGPVVRFFRAPGLWLQMLTTKIPDAEMLEVAIAAFKAAQTGSPDGEGEAVVQEDKERVLL